MLKVLLTRAVHRTGTLWAFEDGTVQQDGRRLQTHLQRDVSQVMPVVPSTLLRWT